MSSIPDVLTLHSADGSALLTLSLAAATPALTLSRGDRTVLSGHITGFPSLSASHCTVTTPTTSSLQLTFPSADASLTIAQSEDANFSVAMTAASSTPFLEAAFALAKADWFGLGHLMYQHWPLQRGVLQLGPFYPFDNGPNGVCTLLGPTVLSTSGALIVADDTSRCLHVALNASPLDDASNPPPHIQKPLVWGTGVANFDRKILPALATATAPGDGMFRLQSRAAYDWRHVHHPWLASVEDGADTLSPELRFTIGATDHVRAASDAVLRKLREDMGVPSSLVPPTHMMRHPIWSTWARYKDAVRQEDVLHFARDIVARDLPRSVMGIDDRWSVKYGDLEFDKVKFPNPAAMVAELHELGFLVTVWVTPFANIDSEAVSNPETRRFFVHTKDGKLGEFEWWQPTMVAALDVTNEEACEWFSAGLRRLCDEYGLDGFKFDAGEPSFLPKSSALEKTMVSPSEYTRAWIHRVASQFKVAEVRSGVNGCQSAGTMFRLFDKFSTWGLENGLASVLAALLTSGMLGYPFCIPDYIAGNAYGDEVPDAELMIRWAQACAAMPAMQFSIPPWNMGDECERLCENALRWREDFFWPRIKDCLEGASKDYVPICRAMWWEEPEQDGVSALYDQFMVGNDVVVAPVVNPGQRYRDVFLPSGSWRQVNFDDPISSDVTRHAGPTWLRDVSADLGQMPTFVRAD